MKRLFIEGEVAQSLEVGPDELSRLAGQVPDVSAEIPGRRGSGVRLGALLDAARPEPHARFVTLHAADGEFSASVPLDAVRGAIVVYSLDGEPLPASMGGPYRFLIPNAAACHTAPVDTCANVKYVHRIELSSEPGKDTRPTSKTEVRTRHQAGKP